MLQLQEAYCMLSGNYIISSGYLYRINLTHMEKQKMQSRISRNRPDQDFIHLLPSGYFAYSMWLQLSTNLVSQAFWTKSSPEPQSMNWNSIRDEIHYIFDNQTILCMASQPSHHQGIKDHMLHATDSKTFGFQKPK